MTVQTPDEALEQASGLWRSAVVRATWELRVAEHLRDGADTAEALAGAAGLAPRGARVLLEGLVAIGFAERAGERYTLVPMAQGLLLPEGLGGLLATWLSAPSWQLWSNLSDSVRTGEPADAFGYDHDYWPRLARATALITRMFGAGTAAALGAAPGTIGRVLDLGCGSGGIGHTLLLADPTATLVSLDSPAVLEVAAEHAEALGLGERTEHREVDLLGDHDPNDGLGLGMGLEAFDLVVCSKVLHHFSASHAQRLIAHMVGALRPGGRLVVGDFLAGTAFGALFDALLLLTAPDGALFSGDELAAWLDAAGLVDLATHELPGASILAIARKPA